MKREEFIGDVVRHTVGGVVHCDAEPDLGKVAFGPHDCRGQMKAGDRIIIYYEDDHERPTEGWFQRFRFCANCDRARTLSEQAREAGIEQVVVEGFLEPFEGSVEGEFYEDAVRLIDPEVIAHSSASEG